MKATLLAVALLCARPVPCLDAQTPRTANPERPTVATHAYTVAPGYAELEQGARAFGVSGLAEATSWDFNLKVGVRSGLQLGFFGAGYVRTGAGAGVGDVGLSLKASRVVSPKVAVAVVPAMTVPSGDAGRGLGAGRALGSLVGVFSADLPKEFHFDANAGPVGIGAGQPQWFTSLGLAHGGVGAVGVATELFDFTGGGAGPRQRGLLAAVMVTVVDWVVMDAGGVRGLVDGTPDQLFLGVTTNLGRIFN
jgi:hypothetical protein